jgi:putative transposase
VSDTKAGIDRYVMFYNSRRPHRSLDRRTPAVVYCQSLPLAAAA